jgi:plasmid stabilization system protein ParE
VSRGALAGINRCRQFLAARNPRAANEASDTIDRYLLSLKTHPEIGRLLSYERGLRELVIPFGDSGYVARYRFDPSADIVFVTGLRHQREASF